MRYRLFGRKSNQIMALLAVALSSVSLHAGTDIPVHKTSFTGGGEHIDHFKTPQFGRYSIQAKSKKGVSVQLVDKMSGVGTPAGIVGEKNGRLDPFLDKGEYRVVARAHQESKDAFDVAVLPYVELHTGKAPQLIEYKLVSDELQDLQQRSYWIHIPETRVIDLEAAGRSLADMRLWKDGKWLVEGSPQRQKIDPKVGEPLHQLTLVKKLQPGLYLLTLYGGEALPWAESDTATHPVHLRWGVPKLSSVDRRTYIASPFGIDRFRVPGRTDHLRIEIPEMGKLSVEAGRYSRWNPFQISRHRRANSLTKKSRLPALDIRLEKHSGDDVVTIRRTAGQPYILEHFYYGWDWDVPVADGGKYWISMVQGGDARDSIDSTAILVRYPILSTSYYNRRAQYVDGKTLGLNQTANWRRKFNMLSRAELHIEVKQAGRYTFTAHSDIKPRLKLVPFIDHYSGSEVRPIRVDLGQSVSLSRGFYFLTLSPEEGNKGIVDMQITGSKPASEQIVQSQPVQFNGVSLHKGYNYRLSSNRQPGIVSGLTIRKLPIQLNEEPLPLTIRAGETIPIQVTLSKLSTIEALAVDGKRLQVGVRPDDWPKGDPTWKAALVLPEGSYIVLVKAVHDHVTMASLAVQQTALLPKTALPVIDDKLLQGIPQFTKLSETKPHFLDMGKRETQNYSLGVTEPALYRVESSGLLRTSGTIRSQAVTSIAKRSENGVGRNFLVQRFLRPGEYQVSVKTKGKSAGHLGVKLVKTPMLNAGAIKPDVMVRHTLTPGEGAKFQLNIPKAGEYYIDVTGVNADIPYQLVDKDGWPVHNKVSFNARHQVMPTMAARVTSTGVALPGHHIRDRKIGYKLQAGSYELVVNPTALRQRMVVHVASVAKRPTYTGAGPFSLVYEGNGVHAAHVWNEPAEGQPRKPHTWQFNLPAKLPVHIWVNGDAMVGELFTEQKGQWVSLGKASTVKQLIKELPKGKYKVDVKSVRKNNDVAYGLWISSDYWVVGQPEWVKPYPLQQQFKGDRAFKIATGEEGLLRLESMGSGDVYARLFKEGSNTPIASNDDRENDWNFLIAKNVPAGRYHLQVKHLGRARFKSLSITSVPARTSNTVAFPATETIPIGKQVLYPLAINAKNDEQIHILTASCSGQIGIAVEQQRDGQWTTLGQDIGSRPWLALVAQQGANYRVRVWPVGQQSSDVTLNTYLGQADETKLADLAKGVDAGKLVAEGIYIRRANIQSAGIFNVDVDETVSDFRWNRASVLVKGGKHIEQLIAPTNKLWLVQRVVAGQHTSKVQVTRRVVNQQTLANPVQVTAKPNENITVDLDATESEVRLVTVESRIGQPRMAIQGIGWAIASGTGVANKSLAAVAADGVSSKVTVGSSETYPLPITVQQRAYRAADREALEMGTYDRVIAQGVAQGFSLPHASRVQLVLPARTAAVFRRYGLAIATVWSGDEAQSYTLEADADDVMILHAHASAQTVTINVNTVSAGASLDIKQPLKRYYATAGVSVIPIVTNKARTLHALSNIEGNVAAQFIGNSGKVSSGNFFEVDETGVLLLQHKAGFAIAWLDDISTAANSVALQANNQLQGTKRTYSTKLAQPAMIRLNSSMPGVVVMEKASGVKEMAMFAAGIQFQTYAPAGESKFTIMPLHDGVMSGQLVYSTLAATTLQEGQGPATRLAPGAARLYKFNNTRKAKIGMGVTASADVVSTRLFDAKGKVLGDGVVQMHELDAGDYYMMVSVPANGVVVEAKPAVVNVKDRGDGPPDEVLKKYLPKKAQ